MKNLRNIKIIIPFLLAIFIAIGFYIDNISVEKTYKITSNYGFLDEAIELLKQNKYVAEVDGAYAKSLDETYIIESINENVEINEGRYPEKEHEIVVNKKINEDKVLGDTIDISGVPFKIVGFYENNLKDNVYGYCLTNDFDNSSYDVLNITVKYSGNVDEAINQTKQEINDNHKTIVYDDLNERIKQLQSKYDLLKDNIDNYSSIINKEFINAQDKIDSSQNLINKYEKQLRETKEKLDSAKKQIEDGEKIINSSYDTLTESKKEIDKAKSQLDSKLSVYGVKAEDLKQYLNTAENKLIEYGYTIEFVENHYDTIVNLETYINALDNLIDKAIDLLNKDLEEDEEKELETIWDNIEYYFDKLKDFLHIDRLERFVITNLEELKADLANLNEKRIEIIKLVDIKVSIDDIKKAIDAYNTIKNYENEYNKKYKEYEDYLSQYEQAKVEYKENLDKYNSALKQLEDYKEQLSNSKSKLINEKNKYKNKINNYDNDLNSIEKDIELLNNEKDNINIEWTYSDLIKEDHSIILLLIYSLSASVITILLAKVLYKYEKKKTIIRN